MKRTWQPKKRKRNRTHGFRARMKDLKGRLVIKRRRLKKRAKVTIVPSRTKHQKKSTVKK